MTPSSKRVSHETKADNELPQSIVDLLPATWSEVAVSENVTNTDVTRALAAVMQRRGIVRKGFRPPMPKDLGREVVDAIPEVLRRHKRSYKTVSRGLSAREELEIRKAIDEEEASKDLLGKGLCERVAEKLDVRLEVVLKVLEDRTKALRFEQRVRRENEAIERGEVVGAAERRTRAATARREAATDRDAAALARRPPPPPAPAPAPAAPVARPTTVPEPREDHGLDVLLRAAWVAVHGGIEGALEKTHADLCARFKKSGVTTTITLEDTRQAIEAAFAERSLEQQDRMKKQAMKVQNDRKKNVPDQSHTK